MRLRRFIATFVLALPASCAAETPSQSVPQCDLSNLPFTAVEVTTDTQGVNFGPYGSNMIAVIRKNWYSRVPPAAMPPISKRGCVVIEFEIVRNGTISSVRYKFSSGDITLDQAAFDAVSAASPLPALPAEFKHPSATYQFIFKYNAEPGSGTASDDIAGNAFDFRYPARASSNNVPSDPVSEASQKNKDQDIRLGAPIQAVDPVIPKSLYGKNAAAVVEATIEADGTFNDLSALVGDRDFEYAAMDAVHQWRYASATENGRPANVKVFITFFWRQNEIKTSVEPDLPLPDGPKRNMPELYSEGELFAVDGQHVKPPKAIYAPDPEYSMAARAAKRQGTVLLGVILGRDGAPEDIWPIRKLIYSTGEQTFKPVGLGLEQKAIEAVSHWKFEPAMKDGEPVPVLVNIEVKFHIY
jgi:TonB family protein